MKMCFIDDEVSRWTLDVLISVRDYAKVTWPNVEVECELLAVSADWENRDNVTYEYFKSKYFENRITLSTYKTKEELHTALAERVGQKILFMIDLNLRKDEEYVPETQPDYKFLSMEVMEWLKNETYHLYSAFVEQTFMDKWSNQFKKIYGRDVPEVIERELLQPNCFSRKSANKVLGVVDR